jgi:putative peptidoglycan lipid II flippase
MSRRVTIASLIWGGSILLSRVIGLIREAVLGRVLGAGRDADLYLASFVVPDFLNYLLAAGALSIVFIPLFSAHLARGDEAAGWRAFSVIANVVSALLVLLVGALWLAMPALVPLFAPGFSADDQAALVHLSRIVLPAQIFHVLGGLLGAALQARDRHGLSALAPLVYTVGIIAGGLLGGSAEGFAWGVLVGSAAGPFALPLYGCVRMGLRWSPTLSLSHPDLRRWFTLSLPVMLGFSIVVVDDWFLTRAGSTLGEGAIAALRYAKSLMRVPMGVFGLATGVAAYPTLTRLIAEGRPTEAWDTLLAATRSVLVLATLSQVGLTVAGPDISRVLYGSRIDAATHDAIGLSLAVLCLGLWAWSAQTLLARGFYALQQTWAPTLLGTAITLLAWPVYDALAATHGALGLAIASSLAISAYVAVLAPVLARRMAGRAPGLLRFALTLAAAAAAAIALGLAVRGALSPLPALLRGALSGGLATTAAAAALLALRLPEAQALTAKVRRRLRR